ncbi:hypothetical protein BH10BAC5_BH10BAC5_11040 [soil metagenome]
MSLNVFKKSVNNSVDNPRSFSQRTKPPRLKAVTGLNKNKIPGSIFAGIFIIALSTLLLEFTLTRILSVALWYHFAFMIISVALLGFGVSGVFVATTNFLKKFKISALLSVLSLIYGLSVIICFLIMNNIPFDPFSLLTDSMQFVFMPVYYILISIPFFFSGLVITVIISNYKQSIHKLYFFDLTGAGLACVAFVIFIPMLGGNGTIFIIAALGFIASAVFAFKESRSILMTVVILAFFSMTFLIDVDHRFPINVTPNKIYGNYIKDRQDLNSFSEWNTFSKVDVMKEEEHSEDGYDVQLAIIDEGNATTNIPNVKKLPPDTKPADASNLAFVTNDDPDKVFIIGSAGGGEILVSLFRNAKKIEAVEINGILNDLISKKMLYWTGPLVAGNNKVELITDDARSVITNSPDKYDVIISAHTISSSAVSSGAMSMVENYVLTQEAVSQYISHLTDDGVLYISRPETQVPKLITTLKKLNDAKNNIVVFRRPPNDFENDKSFLAGILYKKNGFSAADIDKLKNEAAMLSLKIEYDPVTKQSSIYKDLIESNNIDENISNSKMLIAPATDDKPFFDRNVGFANLTWSGIRETFSQNEKGILALKDKPVSETTLIVILLQTIIIAGLLIFLPLRMLSKRNEKNKTISKAETGNGKKILPYFACLGAGYIMIQIALIQKFTLFLGQPVVTLLTVISVMLFASGMGSMYSVRLIKDKHDILNIAFGGIILLTLLIGMLNPVLFNAFSGQPQIIRIPISVLLIFPLGFLLGIPFPYGMDRINSDEKNIAAFAWGINGFFSVLGTVLVMILAMVTGYRIVFIVSAAIYAGAYFIMKKRMRAMETLAVDQY